MAVAGLSGVAVAAGGGGVRATGDMQQATRRGGCREAEFAHRQQATVNKCTVQGAIRFIVGRGGGVIVLMLWLVGCAAQESLVLPWGQAIGGPVAVPANTTMVQPLPPVAVGLHRIDLYLQSTQATAFEATLIEPEAGEPLRRVTGQIAANTNGRYSLAFAPLMTSDPLTVNLTFQANQPLTLLATTATTNTFTLGADSQRGRLLLDGYSLDTYSPARLLEEIGARTSRDRAFFAGYGILLLAITMATLIVATRLQRQST